MSTGMEGATVESPASLDGQLSFFFLFHRSSHPSGRGETSFDRTQDSCFIFGRDDRGLATDVTLGRVAHPGV